MSELEEEGGREQRPPSPLPTAESSAHVPGEPGAGGGQRSSRQFIYRGTGLLTIWGVQSVSVHPAAEKVGQLREVNFQKHNILRVNNVGRGLLGGTKRRLVSEEEQLYQFTDHLHEASRELVVLTR